ncbi:hypothetical protein BpHYR1_030129 [Brachionus plicatilis]|uniref:Uncharacterized protein n=1 Tax=Brachionus plicatilis TaxID=10195 RepID=A0A3M7RLY8_BRAPC|nr:hypothetical protein BpHYR1_030129 [Brachionus plicatilis]
MINIFSNLSVIPPLVLYHEKTFQMKARTILSSTLLSLSTMSKINDIRKIALLRYYWHAMSQIFESCRLCDQVLTKKCDLASKSGGHKV